MKPSPRLLIALVLALSALFLVACGDDEPESTTTAQSTSSDADSGGKIKLNDANAKVQLTIGSKNFTEQKVLGEIYAQG